MHLKKITLFPEKYPTKDHYPFNQVIFQTTASIAFRTPVTFFVGENGTGKSTLLTAICKKCGVPIWQTPAGTRYEPNPYEKVLYLFMAVEWTDGSVPGSFSLPRRSRILPDIWMKGPPQIQRYWTILEENLWSPSPTVNRWCRFSGVAIKSGASTF